MIVYKTLEGTSIDELYSTFIEAFYDYEVKMELKVSKFENMLKKNGYIAKASIGAFEKGRLVGFSLTAVRNFEGMLSAYDIATGIIKEYRNKGIASKMFTMLKDKLKSFGVKKYQLEVIQDNIAAVKTYKKQGFIISRKLNCYNFNKRDLKSNVIIGHKNSFTDYEWRQISEFWDFSPTWQNSIESIKNSDNKHIYGIIKVGNNIVGYGIIDTKTGDIQQIAVNKKYRGRGYGKIIVSNLIKWAKSRIITILNIDSEDYLMKGFLKHLGFTDYVKQYEMILKL